MNNGSGSARIWIAIVIVLAAIWFIAHAGPSKIPGLGPLWISANVWFKGITGLSLDTIVIALWRLILWVLKTLLSLLWTLLNSALSLVRK